MEEITFEQAVELQEFRLNHLRRNLEIFKHPSTPKNSEKILLKRQEIWDGDLAEFKRTHERICVNASIEARETLSYFTDEIFEAYMEVYFQFSSEIDFALQNLKLQNMATDHQTSAIEESNEINKIIHNSNSFHYLVR